MKGESVAIYFDMDGVLADWVGQYESSPGLPPLSEFNKLSKSERDSYKKDLFSYEFFRNMKPLPKGIKLIKDYIAKGFDVYVNSATGNFNQKDVGRAKREWIKQHVGNVPVILVTKTEYKWEAIEPVDVNVLYDDREKSIRAWEQKGGEKAIGILYEGK